jgi:hypothetical protein
MGVLLSRKAATGAANAATAAIAWMRQSPALVVAPRRRAVDARLHRPLPRSPDELSIDPGPSSALTRTGITRTPDEDGAIYVLPHAVELDLDGALCCDWRDGRLVSGRAPSPTRRTGS